jgi:hypothetical protein
LYFGTVPGRRNIAVMMLLWSPPSIDYPKTQSSVDMDRLGMMGWSHGGFITSLNLTREGQPFRRRSQRPA